MVERDFPGFLGFTSQGVIAIHADWPAYPAEHGWEVALVSLGNFPAATRFRAIDDIDKCVLFVAEGTTRGADDFAPAAMHIAIWHEDLAALAERRLIDGVTGVSERRYEQERRDLLGEAFVQLASGDYVPLELPDLGQYDDDRYLWPEFDASGIALTSSGLSTLDTLLRRSFKLPPSVQSRLLPMLDAELFDSAVREAALLLEVRLRLVDRSDRYGVRLVESFTRRLVESGHFRSSNVKVLRLELLTAFKFIRNEFAHHALSIERARAYALLSRLCTLISVVESLADGGFETHTGDS